MKKWLGYGIFFVILFGLFLLFTFIGTDDWKEKIPVANTVKPFQFTNQDGQPFTLHNMEGKVCVVNFFFTTCKGICPKMNNNIDKIYDEFKNQPDFMIVSHTSDPDRDSAAQLKHYADSMKVDTRKWVFVTGRKDSLYKAARNSYLLDDPNNNVGNINDQFLHTQFIALIDKNGNVRGQVFDGLKPDEMNMLKDDINKLLNEKQTVSTSNFSNNTFGNQ